ncbi:hypothetical protein K3727_19135 [Rhodobacteraceae bacterium M382]|nr:hypothetical protein K3727_19135 [Rhodobacteraceae bacterium M382]
MHGPGHGPKGSVLVPVPDVWSDERVGTISAHGTTSDSHWAARSEIAVV